MKLFVTLFLILAVVVFGISFTLKNTAPVQLNYYLGWQWNGSLSWLLVMTLIIGAVLGVLFTTSWVIRVKRQASALRKEVALLEREAASLRSIGDKENS